MTENEKIAHFVGGTHYISPHPSLPGKIWTNVHPTDKTLGCATLAYHNDYHWIMSVVDIIKHNYAMRFYLTSTEEKIFVVFTDMSHLFPAPNVFNGGKITGYGEGNNEHTAIYNAVTNFIDRQKANNNE